MARILIVDDSPIMRKNLRAILTQAGHTVIAEASNGTQAYIEYNKHRPDLVTMDITMPYMNGLDTFKKILKSYPDAKIIIISSSSDNMVILDAIQSGAKNYIIKPFVVDKVLEVVNQVLKLNQKASNETINKIYNVIQTPSLEEDVDFAESFTGLHEENPEPEPQYIYKPFSIQLKNNTFIIHIHRDINQSGIAELVDMLQGFLYVNPLKMVFEMNSLRKSSPDLMNLLIGYLAKVYAAHGKSAVVSRGNEIYAYFKSQNAASYTEFYSDLTELNL